MPDHSDEHACTSCDHDHGSHDEPVSEACVSCDIGPGPACTTCEWGQDDSHGHTHEKGGWTTLAAAGVAIALGILLETLGVYRSWRAT